jgi:hypothetical protein
MFLQYSRAIILLVKTSTYIQEKEVHPRVLFVKNTCFCIRLFCKFLKLIHVDSVCSGSLWKLGAGLWMGFGITGVSVFWIFYLSFFCSKRVRSQMLKVHKVFIFLIFVLSRVIDRSKLCTSVNLGDMYSYMKKFSHLFSRPRNYFLELM